MLSKFMVACIITVLFIHTFRSLIRIFCSMQVSTYLYSWMSVCIAFRACLVVMCINDVCINLLEFCVPAR